MAFPGKTITKYLAFIYKAAMVAVAMSLTTKWAQFNSICILVAVGAWLLSPNLVGRLRDAFKRPVFLGLGALYLGYLVSIIYSQDASGGWRSLETRFSLLALPLLFASGLKLEKKDIHRVFVGFSVTCIIVSLVCLITNAIRNFNNGIYYADSTSWYFSADNLVEQYGFHPSYFSLYCAFVVFIIVYFISNKMMKWYWGLVPVIYLFFFQLLLASRVSTLALFIVAGISILYVAYLNGKFLSGLGMSALLFVVLLIGLFSVGTMRDKINAMLNRNVDQYNEAFKFDARAHEWQSSWEVFRSSPLIGVGIGDTKAELREVYLKHGYSVEYENSYDSHSLIMDTLICVGIVGIVLLVPMFYLSFKQAIATKNIIYLQFLGLFVLISLVESSLSVQKGVVFFAFFNSLFWLHSGNEKTTSQNTLR